MNDAKRIPYGVSNFVEVVEQNQYYVDKTMYLPLLEKQPSSLFFIRPRRFGKSIFLRYFFSISHALPELMEHWHNTLTIIAAADWMISHLFMNHTIIRALH